MTNLGWTCPTCKTNWAPSVLKCDCGPTLASVGGPKLATVTMDQNAWVERDTRAAPALTFGPGGTA